MMRKVIHSLTAIIAASFITGCASMDSAYRPDTLGLSSVAHAVNGLKISIRPDTDAAILGDKLKFNLTAHNVSSQPMYLPRNPNLLFCWVYASGRRDNYVVDHEAQRHYQKSELVLVQPGHAVRYTKRIETYYFPKRGITEFVAIFDVPRNTNPNLIGVWSGQAESNKYGVLVDKAKRIARYQAEHTDERATLTLNRTGI